ncbi:hypothetical protein [Fructobacillus fructosus]|uniref:hypothetical protein n=1 Tax=Fructobacillus fructosus TaxID=1631 RepID=UPI002D9FE767|nr:hypothetical protein LMG30235_GOPAMIKF_01354 [Fructobacillus fructosus]CAK1251377.1 hypothetical protein R54866_LGPIEIPA_01414 [Fructobacillus fructosus]CAK1251795.1 hypothetical protein LMG30234_GAICNKDF_01444 [Fructobacillus fructosus]
MVNKIYIKDEMLPRYIKQLEHFRKLYQQLVATMIADSENFQFAKNARNFNNTLIEAKALASKIKNANSADVYSDVLNTSKRLDLQFEELVDLSLQLTFMYTDLMNLLLGFDYDSKNGLNLIENQLAQAKKQLRNGI